jgi:ABC-type sugar transport system permease subunit
VRAATPTNARLVSARKASGGLRALTRVADLLFLLPILAVIGIFIVLPSISVVAHAFTDWDPGYASPWVGLRNFEDLATSPQFRQILENQGIFLLGLPLWIFLPLLIAAMLYERVPAPGVFRTIFFFPATVSPAVIGILFSFILLPDGPLNSALRSVGLGALAGNWLTQPNLVRPTLIAILAWATLGTGVVIFSAALSVVSPELFEAAALDGASWWQRFRYIVVPGVRRVIELWAVILVVTVFVAIFPWIFTLTRGGPGYLTTTLDFDIYQNSLSFGYFGTAAAESVYLLVIVAVVIAVGARMFRHEED